MDFVEPRTDASSLPGQSRNPAGKKPGTRNRAALLVAQMMEGDEEAATGAAEAA